MNYLTKENMPKKFTAKQVSTFKRIKETRFGWTANPAWNKQKWGLTELQYAWLRVADYSVNGIIGQRYVAKDFNEALTTFLFDAEGRYLTYNGSNVTFAA